MFDFYKFRINEGLLCFYTGSDSHVVIPSTVEEIGSKTFLNPNIIESVVIPESVFGIDEEVFYNCKKLVSVNIPGSVKYMGKAVFKNCSRLESIEFPESIDTVRFSTFAFCENLRSVTFKGKIKSIEPSAFAGCRKLENITLDEGLERIGSKAFSSCESLQEIFIPDGIEKLGEATFKSCKALSFVSIPDSVTEIGESCFAQCDNLRRIKGMKVRKLGCRAFGETMLVFPEVRLREVADTPLKCNLFLGYLSEPQLYPRERVKEYESYAFRRRKVILDYAFKRDLVAVIEFYANKGKITAENYKSVYLDEAVRHKANQCFSFLAQWKKDNITQEEMDRAFERELLANPFSVREIRKSWTYKNNPGGTITITGYKGSEIDVEIPQKIGNKIVTDVGGYAFAVSDLPCDDELVERRRNIRSVTVPEGIINIGIGAFYGCVNLTQVCLTDGLEYIGSEAFFECKSLTDIKIPESVCEIGSQAFAGCIMLTSIKFPPKIRYLDFGMFTDCTSLREVILPETLEKIGSFAFLKAPVERLAVPASVRGISEHAFVNADKLILIVKEGSCAHKFAVDKQLPFEIDESAGDSV